MKSHIHRKVGLNPRICGDENFVDDPDARYYACLNLRVCRDGKIRTAIKKYKRTHNLNPRIGGDEKGVTPPVASVDTSLNPHISGDEKTTSGLAITKEKAPQPAHWRGWKDCDYIVVVHNKYISTRVSAGMKNLPQSALSKVLYVSTRILAGEKQ